MHKVLSILDPAAERLYDCLMPEANSQHGNPPHHLADDGDGHAGIFGSSRAGGNHQVRRPEISRFPDSDLVMPPYRDPRSQDGQCLHQIVGERVVVIDEQDVPRHRPSSASESAASSAALFASTSACSRSGTLSATMPAPAW